MSTDNSILIRFKQNLIAFCDELIRQFPDESDFVIFKLFISNQIPIQTVIQEFIDSLNKDDGRIRKMIGKRNDVFFINESLFGSVSKTSKNRLSEIWLSDKMELDDKQVIWQWIDSFVKIADKYKKEN